MKSLASLSEYGSLSSYHHLLVQSHSGEEIEVREDEHKNKVSGMLKSFQFPETYWESKSKINMEIEKAPFSPVLSVNLSQ